MNLIAALLHYANASPPITNRPEFYALKHRLLDLHAKHDGYDIQEIRKDCYGPYDRRYDDFEGCLGAECPKCGGTGIYSKRFWRLDRWQWGGYTFHTPAWEIVRELPTPEQVTIYGRIEHRDYGRKPREAVLWLYLLCGEWRLLRTALTGSCCCGHYAWPLLNVQWVVMHLAMYLSWRTCFCGRRYMTWGSGRCVCRKCWNKPSDPIPF